MSEMFLPYAQYHAYLLRFWQEEESTSWRASLEDPHSGETFGFASLRELFNFIESRISDESIPCEDSGKS